MKNLAFMLLLCAFAISLKAQPTNNKLHRTSYFMSVGGSFPLAGRAAFEIITQKGLSYSVFGFLYDKRSRNTPPDYKPGGIKIFGGPAPFVYESLKLVGFTVGKVWWITDNRIRFNLKGGLAFGSTKYPINFRPSQVQGLFYFGANYDHDWKEHHIVDFVVQPTFEFVLSRSFGLSLSPFAHLSKYRTVTGIEAAIIVGQLRGKRLQQK